MKDWSKLTTMTTYQSSYGKKPLPEQRSPTKIVPTAAVVRLEQLLKNRIVNNELRPEITIKLLADVKLSTYKHDFVPYFGAWSAVPIVRPSSPSPHREPASVARTDCGRFTTASPRTNVKYDGAAPPQQFIQPRSEYWSAHSHLASRIIADKVIPKRARRCYKFV